MCRCARALSLLVLWTILFVGCGEKSENEGHAASSARAASPAPTALAAASAAPNRESAAEKGKSSKDAPTTWNRSSLSSNASRLMVGDNESLPLVATQVTVWIDGFRARVVVDSYFANDKARSLEGTFQLRMPSDASPYYFAFGATSAAAAEPPPLFQADAAAKLGSTPEQIRSDRESTWSAPKEAKMVPKEQAAQAYGDTVRQQVDPALVEWAGAGIFNARVFPLDAGKVHRIVLGYDVDLVSIAGELEHVVEVPSGGGKVVVDVSVLQPAGVETTVSPASASSADGDRARWRFEDPSTPIRIRLKNAAGVVLRGNDATGTYFATTFRPTLPSAPIKASSSAAFLLDTSLSSNPDAMNVWVAMLEQILTKNRDTMKKFALLVFDVDTHWYQPHLIDNTPDNVAAVLKYVRSLSLEGATDLGAALREAGTPSWWKETDPPTWDVFLLSDGAVTWGESDAFIMGRALRRSKLFAYQTGLAGTDTASLNTLVRESGGALFSVTGDAEVAAAAIAHRARPLELEKIEVSGGSDLLIAGRPRAIFPGQTVLLVGRGNPPAATEISMTLKVDGKSQKVTTKLGPALSSALAPRIYGQIATQQLEELGGSAEPLATSYAQHFRVTGKTCSLLMLETEADYQRRGISPDDGVGAVKAEQASARIERALIEQAETLGNAKASFIAWLRRMEKMPGVTLTLPEKLWTAIESLPPSTFAVASPPLAVKARAAADLSEEFKQLLQTHKVEYDAFTKEASRRKEALGGPDALRALSSLVEENPGDGVMARDVGYSALEWGLAGQAYHLFRRVSVSRPYEPQTYRAMAGALASMGRFDLAAILYEVGLQGSWDGRFGDFKQILAVEYLHLLRTAKEMTQPMRDWTEARREELEKSVAIETADIVVMITWNTDNTDVDLHVLEPSGEDCHYKLRNTRLGGTLTADVTRGYGPEMYVMKTAVAGNYKVTAHYFASDANRTSTRTKVHAVIYENWGKPNEKVRDEVVTLETGKSQHSLATIER